MLIRRWADKDESGAPRVRAVTVGTGEVNYRAHPRNVMTSRGYVPPQYVSGLEHGWRSAESDAGNLIKAGDPQAMLDDDHQAVAAGGAVRRLMIVHIVRGYEATLSARHLAQQQGDAAADDNELVLGWQEIESVQSGLLLPSWLAEERARESVRGDFEQHARHTHAEALPGLYGKALAACSDHSLRVAAAPPGSEFVLGDSPACTARCRADGEVVKGLGTHRAPLGPGTEVWMPLGPRLCAVLSDCHYPLPAGDTIDEQAVTAFNNVQCDRAIQQVVCTRTAPDALMDRLVTRVTGRWGHDVKTGTRCRRRSATTECRSLNGPAATSDIVGSTVNGHPYASRISQPA